MITKAENDSSFEYESDSVEIKLYNPYVLYCHNLTPIFSRAAMHFIQGSVELGYVECEFFLPKIPRLCVVGLVRGFRELGIELEYEEYEEEGESGFLFYADLSRSVFFM